MSGFLGTNISTLHKDDADFYFQHRDNFQDRDRHYQAWIISDIGIIVSCDSTDGGGYISIYSIEDFISVFNSKLNEEEKSLLKSLLN